MSTDSYETTRLRHVAFEQQIMAELMLRLNWSRAQIEAEQSRALRAFLRHAIDNSRWHRVRLRGLDLEDFCAARLSEIAPMTKHDLMENWDAIVTDPRCRREAAEVHLAEIARTGADAYFIDEYHVVASGGSSGRRGVFVHDWHSWAVCFAGIMRGLARVASRTPTKAAGPFAVVAAHVPTHMSSAVTRTFSDPSRTTVHAPVTLPISQIVEVLNRAQPAILVCYASMLPMLCEETAAGRLRIDPALIWSTSEVLLPEIRAAAEATWSVPVVNSWVASESHGAFACHVGPGFHIGEDINVIELVDDDCKAVTAGVRSAKILLKNFSNRLMPLIRYEMSDQFQLATSGCGCGSAYQKIEDLQGRAEEIFEYRGALKVHPHVFTTILGREAAITMYRVRQTEHGAAVEVIGSSAIDLREIASMLEQGLARVGLENPKVTVYRVDEIQRQNSGKLKRFIWDLYT